MPDQHDEQGASEEDPGPSRTRATDGPTGNRDGDSSPWFAVVAGGIVVLLALFFVFGRDGGNVDSARKEGAQADGSGENVEADAENEKPNRSWPVELKWKPMELGVREESVHDVPPDVAAGVYVWSDFDGWHTWIVDPAAVGITSGRVRTDSEFGSAELVDEGAGAFTRNDSVLEFDFGGLEQRVTGFRYNPGFFTSKVTYEFDGVSPPVFLGHRSTPMDGPTELVKKVR